MSYVSAIITDFCGNKNQNLLEVFGFLLFDPLDQQLAMIRPTVITITRQRDDFLPLWLINRIQIMNLDSKEWESLNPGSHLASDNKLDINRNLKKNLDETKINLNKICKNK